jgi:hypothetical protein
MRLVPHDSPAPQLLKTALERRERLPEGNQAGSGLTTGSNFSGKDRAFFVAVVLGAILLCFIAFNHWRQRASVHPARGDDKLPAVSKTPVAAAEPVAKISDQIHVTAISLGNLRMAIINGRLVGEGETITLHPAGAPAAVSLRVRKISDGEIEFNDGAQVIKARMEWAPVSKPKR